MFYYVYCLTQICIFKTYFYTKTQVLIKPGLKSYVIPPKIITFQLKCMQYIAQKGEGKKEYT